MANRYWIGGTGVWSDASNHWAASSGGSGAADNLPTINDDVYFNALSFDASGTITLDISANCKNFDWTGLDSSVWLRSAVQSAYIYGDVSLNSNLTWAFTGTAYTYLTPANASVNIISNGVSISGSRVYFNGPGSTFLFRDSANFPLAIVYPNSGKIVTNDFSINAYQIRSWGNVEYDFGSSYITLTQFWNDSGVITGTLGTSTINISVALGFSNLPFYNLVLTGAPQIWSNPTVTNKFIVQGTNASTGRYLVASNTLGSLRTINAADVSLANVDFRDISTGGTANWDLSNIPGGSGDCGGNRGITFTPSTSCYFVHTSGPCYWSDASKWMTTSGGSTYARGPLPQDDAIFDENSFTGNSNLFTNITRLPNIDYTNIDVSLTMSLTSNIQCYRNVIFNNNITVAGNYSFALLNRSTYSVDLKNKHIYSLNPTLGNCIINSDIDSNILIIGAYGIPMSFDLNDFNISANTMYIQYGVTSAKLGNGIINLYSSDAGNILGINYVPGFNAENSTIIFNSISGTNNINVFLYVHTYQFNKLIFAGTHQGFYILSSSNILCKEFIVNSHKKIQFTAGSTITILDKFIASGTSDASIYIGSTTSSPFILNASTGNTRMQVEHCFIQNSTASPNNRWYAQNSTDLGGNSGWNFKEYSLKPIRIGNKIINKHIEK